MKVVLDKVICREMELRGWTYEHLSKVLGICQTTLYGWSTGAKPTRADLIFKLAELLKRDNENIEEAFFRMYFGDKSHSFGVAKKCPLLWQRHL